MARTHPHAEATYRIVPLKEGTFGVEIEIPGSYPTKVTSFATEADAEAWIADHQTRVQAEAQSSRWFQPSGSSA